MRKEQEFHLRRKEQARAAKAADKLQNPNEKVVAAFDLQLVLPCPHLEVDSVYYL